MMTNWVDYAAGFVTVNVHLHTSSRVVLCFCSFLSSTLVDVCVIESCVYMLYSNHGALDDQVI